MAENGTNALPCQDVTDYVDRGVPGLARMLAKRLRGYDAIGYRCDDGAFAFALDSDGPDAE